MFWLTFAFYAFVGWFFLKFDPFSISSKTASISEDVLMRLIAPLYPADHQNDIAIVLIDARTLRYLDDDWPILYRHHQRILEEILYYEPKAVMVNVWFRRSRVRLTDIGASFFESPMFPLTTDIEAERAAARLKDVLDVARDDLRPVVARLADRLRSVPTKLFFARGRAGDAYAGELDEMPATPVVTVWHAEPRRYPLILDGGRALNEQAGLAVTDPSSSARLADADGSPPAYTAAFQIYRFLCLSGGVRCRDKEVDDGDFTQPLALVWGGRAIRAWPLRASRRRRRTRRRFGVAASSCFLAKTSRRILPCHHRIYKSVALRPRDAVAMPVHTDDRRERSIMGCGTARWRAGRV
jgi:hypothetical protein